MSPEELQANFVQAVLYYVGVTTSDSNRYFGWDPQTLSPDIGTLAYDEFSNLFVDGWELGSTKPDNATLSIPDLATVLAWYVDTYQNPQLINNAQLQDRLTAAELASVEKSHLLPDSLAYDTTNELYVYRNGSDWIPLNAVLLAARTSAAAVPRPLVKAICENAAMLSLNAGQVKNMAAMWNAILLSDFTFHPVTGILTYTGRATKSFDIEFSISVAAKNSAVSGNVAFFVNVNGQTQIPTAAIRRSVSFPGSRQSVSVRDVVELSHGSTVTLGVLLRDGTPQQISLLDCGLLVN